MTNADSETQSLTERRHRAEDRQILLQELIRRLPDPIRDAPNIDWSELPTPLLRALVRLDDKVPDIGSLALSVGAALKFIDAKTAHQCFMYVRGLIEQFRDLCAIQDVNQLGESEVWAKFARQTEATLKRYTGLMWYTRVTEEWLPVYIGRLTPPQQLAILPFVLSAPPPGFLRRHGNHWEAQQAVQQRRKSQSDVVAPLCQVLVTIIQFRKQGARQLYDEFREVKKQIEAGKIQVPYVFEYDAVLPEVNLDVPSVADIKIVGRQVRMRFTAWLPSAWMLAHSDDYGEDTIRLWRKRVYPLSSDTDQLFLEFMGPASDLLWFGDLVEHRLVQNLKSDSSDLAYQQRLTLAKELGDKSGFITSRSGLLNPGGNFGRWFSGMQRKSDALVFDPESLYWGILYGAALATITLTNGSRAGELQQISLDRFKKRSVDEIKDDRPTGRKIYMAFQLLLPKGAKSPDDLRLFPMSRISLRLLDEIAEHHYTIHGQIPIVDPSPHQHQYDLLKPERYLFQWTNNPDQKPYLLRRSDFPVLIRFVLHGIELYTGDGERVVFTTHLLRHVMATAALHDYEVPLEALALVLHHGLRTLAMLAESNVPEQTMYYSRQPEHTSFAHIQNYQRAVEQPIELQLVMPDEMQLARIDATLRKVFEIWHTLNPTLFGFCGCPTLCPRENNRELCIGCPFLIPDPDKMNDALHWQKQYETYAQELHMVGQKTDARQAQAQANQLRDLVNVMRMQQKAIQQDNYVPAFRILPE